MSDKSSPVKGARQRVRSSYTVDKDNTLTLAKLIADDLFHMQTGEKADHLCLYQGIPTDGGNYLGGWSEPAAIDRIRKILQGEI